MTTRGRDRVRALLTSAASALLCCAFFLTGLPLWGLAVGDTGHTRMAEQRTGGGAPPLALENLEWRPTSPEGSSAVVTADKMTLRRPEFGPFHLALGLEPELRGVELSFTAEGGEKTAIHSESGRLEGKRLVLSGRVSASSPFGELHAEELSWERGAERLMVARGVFAPGATRGRQIRRPTELDLWLRPLGEARSQGENTEDNQSPFEPLEEK